MKQGEVGKALTKLLAPFRRSRGDGYTELAKRMEERAYLVSCEAQAYVDHRISAFKRMPAETDRQIEARTLLATQEAKAYADDAIFSLSMALRGMSRALLSQAGRIDATETMQAGLLEANRTLGGQLASIEEQLTATVARLSAIESQLAIVERRLGDLDARADRYDGAFEARSDAWSAKFDVVARLVEDHTNQSQDAVQRVERINGAFLNLSADLVDAETALREIQSRLGDPALATNAPIAPRRGLRPPATSDLPLARPSE